MNEPLVTIAIPFYNTEQYIAFAIQSVMNQTYRNWELLLIDDGSTDNSLKISLNYAQKDERIRVISDGKNKHLAARLNESIRLAKGEFYARMDDDDIMAKDRIEKQVSYLCNNIHVDVIGTSVMHINGQNKVIGSQNMFGITTGFIHPTVMARTKWLLDNPYSEELLRAQDLDLWLRTYNRSIFYNLPEALLFYRTTGVPIDTRYKKSMRSLRMIADRYKLYNKSIVWSFKIRFKSYLQSFLFSLLLFFGKQDLIVSFRNIKSVPPEKCLSNEDLKASIKVI